MEATDFSGLVARAVAGLEEVRGCLLVSRDGLTLGAYPHGGEERARHAWDRLESVGEPERGFLVVGDEVWVFARRGPYACIVVATAGAKAGLLLDRMESMLRAAEESRVQAGSAPAARPEAVRRPRTPLHREVRSDHRPPVEPVFEQIAQLATPEQAVAPAEVAPPALEPPVALVAPVEAPPEPEVAETPPPAPEPTPAPEPAPEPAPDPAPAAPIEASIAPPAPPAQAPIVVPDFVQPSSPPTEPTPPGGEEPAGSAAPEGAPPLPVDASANGHGPAEAEFEPPRLARPHTPEPPVPAYEPPSLLGEVGLAPETLAEADEDPPPPEAPVFDPVALDPSLEGLVVPAAAAEELVDPSAPAVVPPAAVDAPLEPQTEPDLTSEPMLEPVPELTIEPVVEPMPSEEPPVPDAPDAGPLTVPASLGLAQLQDLGEVEGPSAKPTPDSPKEETEVDAVALAREFAQLFDEPGSQDGI